jgi:hypothetical protein
MSCRYPIVDAHFYRYRVNGQLIRFDHGDYHAGKGIGYTRLKLADDRFIALFTTHTIAQYIHTVEGDHYRADRLTQMWELGNSKSIQILIQGRFVQLITGSFNDSSPKNHLVVVAGDFNCTPASFEFQAFLKILGPDFIDAYLQYSSQSSTKLTEGHEVTMEGENNRLDYVFFKVSNKNIYFPECLRKIRFGSSKDLK